MRVTARSDYAIRALLELAATPDAAPMRADAIARAQAIPAKFLENLLTDLRRARLIASQRGAEGGYRLAKPAGSISLADVIRAVEGPLAAVRDAAPEDLDYPGPAAHLKDVWIALRASMRSVLEATTLSDVVADDLPKAARKLLKDREAWKRR